MTTTDTLDHMAVQNGRLARVAVVTTVDPATAQVRAARLVYSIKFPLVPERTGWKSGPRVHHIPDKTGLHGARACAALSVIGAVHKRDWIRHKENNPLLVRSQRLQMRMHALWARVFAGHFTAEDPRMLATEAAYQSAHTAIMVELTRLQPIAA